MIKLNRIIERVRQHPIIGVLGFFGLLLGGIVYWYDMSQRFVAWVNPSPVRAALTDSSVQDGQINIALTVEAEALTGSYAWVCVPHGASNVNVLPIARSTALRFSVPVGLPETQVYLLLAQSDLLEISVDLYSGAASDAIIVKDGEQKCG